MASSQNAFATYGPSGYGATPGLPPAYEDYLHGAVHAAVTKTQLLRRRWNSLGYLLAVFLPWSIFAGVLAVVSFPVRTEYALLRPDQLCYVVCILALAVVSCFGFFAFVAWQKRVKYGLQEPSWYSFLFITSLLAWVLGIVLGRANWTTHVAPYYDIVDRNYYTSVDPAEIRGSELMDAGRMTFTDNAYINVSMSESYRDGNIYCVAPIVSGTEPLASYDFWSVGTNCCSDHLPESFHCGQYADRRARSGVRLQGSSNTRFYSLAYQHARAASGISRSSYPIFVEWVQDPSAAVDSLHRSGTVFYLQWAFTLLGVQFAAVSACVAALWYIGW